MTAAFIVHSAPKSILTGAWALVNCVLQQASAFQGRATWQRQAIRTKKAGGPSVDYFLAFNINSLSYYINVNSLIFLPA